MNLLRVGGRVGMDGSVAPVHHTCPAATVRDRTRPRR